MLFAIEGENFLQFFSRILFRKIFRLLDFGKKNRKKLGQMN